MKNNNMVNHSNVRQLDAFCFHKKKERLVTGRTTLLWFPRRIPRFSSALKFEQDLTDCVNALCEDESMTDQYSHSDLDMAYKVVKVVSPSRPEWFDFHGVSMTHIFTDNWKNVQNFQARPDDKLIATYPKAGTTWVSQILDLLYFGQTSPERQKTIPIYERVPFLEICVPTLESGKDLVDKLPTSTRLIKTHFPVQFVPKSFWEQNCRMVYIARNAKDNMVSFHFDCMNRVEPEPGDWNNYFHRFMEGKMVFGSWYDHVSGWWKKKQTCSKIHYMFYEDLIEDTEQEIDKLSCFLDLTPSAEEKKMIAGGVQFDNMKNNEMANQSTSPIFDFKMSPFMRKGKVGDWKNHFKIKCSMKTTRRR